MKEAFTEIISANLGPLIFVVIAGVLCYTLISPDSRGETAGIIIGAALTRVKVAKANKS